MRLKTIKLFFSTLMSKKKTPAKSEDTSAALEVGQPVMLKLAIGEDREATVRVVNEDGTLDLELTVTAEDKRYIPLSERAQEPLLRKSCVKGEEVGNWSAKA